MKILRCEVFRTTKSKCAFMTKKNKAQVVIKCCKYAQDADLLDDGSVPPNENP